MGGHLGVHHAHYRRWQADSAARKVVSSCFVLYGERNIKSEILQFQLNIRCGIKMVCFTVTEKEVKIVSLGVIVRNHICQRYKFMAWIAWEFHPAADLVPSLCKSHLPSRSEDCTRHLAS